MKTLHAGALALLTACAAAPSVTRTAERDAQSSGNWSSYGRDPQGTRFSPLADITRENVASLVPAWTYHTGEIGPGYDGGRRRSLETTPLVVDGTLYLSTPLGRVVALDPETGTERWAFDARVDRGVRFGDFTSRGVSTWLDSVAAAESACRRRIYIATIDARLIALDGATGGRCAGFGDGGTVDLRRGLRNAPEDTSEYEVTSPPAVINGLLVVGSAVADNNRAQAASGEVRAYDARTGALRWTWDPVPQRASDPAYRTWEGESAHRTGAANAWSVIAADPVRDLVFVPTGSPSPDYFGGERLGANRYANSVVALRASTGAVVWHFQTVHHDLWDYDNAAPPALVTVRRAGRSVAAVVQATKSGMLFVLERETGDPIFPVEERPVPASSVPGERAWPTQPFSSLPALSPHHISRDSIFATNDADRAACHAMMSGLRNDGPFTPPSLEGTLVMPSNIGGAHWGGVAIDTTRQIVIVPTNRVAALVQLFPMSSVNMDTVRTSRSRIGWEYTPMRGTPYLMRRRIIISPSGVPCTPPPFGTLVAISLASGTKLWEVPLGSPTPDGPPVGSPSLGGPIVTAGGVVFIAATLDRRIRAYDVESGRELWSAALPAGGKATPMTYRARDGRQYLVIAAGGDGDIFGRSDAIVAFALGKK